MAVSVMLNCKVLVGGYDFSGLHNSLALEYGAEMLDETVFQAGVGTATRLFKPGLKTFSFNGNVFFDTTVDEVMFNRVGATREVMSFANVGETEGDICFTTRGVTATYNPASGSVGELLQGTIEGRNNNQALVRSRLMKRGNITSTGNSTGLNIGSLSGKRIFSGLHVTTPATGGVPSITGIIESDDNSGFTTPTTRLTHAAITVRGADWQEVLLGAVTDNYWRAKWTVSGVETFNVFWTFGYE